MGPSYHGVPYKCKDHPAQRLGRRHRVANAPQCLEQYFELRLNVLCFMFSIVRQVLRKAKCQANVVLVTSAWLRIHTRKMGPANCL